MYWKLYHDNAHFINHDSTIHNPVICLEACNHRNENRRNKIKLYYSQIYPEVIIGDAKVSLAIDIFPHLCSEMDGVPRECHTSHTEDLEQYRGNWLHRRDLPALILSRSSAAHIALLTIYFLKLRHSLPGNELKTPLWHEMCQKNSTFGSLASDSKTIPEYGMNCDVYCCATLLLLLL